MAAEKTLVVQLTYEQSQLLQQEQLRLQQDYGIRLNASEIVQILIEEHRLRLQVVASEDSDARWWMYQTIADLDDDEDTDTDTE
jgi:hypothetical protein